MEQPPVQFGHSSIPYIIHRSQRQKIVAVVMDPVEGASVRTPRGTQVGNLDTIVHHKTR